MGRQQLTLRDQEITKVILDSHGSENVYVGVLDCNVLKVETLCFSETLVFTRKFAEGRILAEILAAMSTSDVAALDSRFLKPKSLPRFQKSAANFLHIPDSML
jgi:hypothetical protein